MKHIVFVSGGGRLGNQLLNAANFTAFAKEYKQTLAVTNLAIVRYLHYFKYDVSILNHNKKSFRSQCLRILLSLVSHDNKTFVHFYNFSNSFLHCLAHILYNNQSIVLGKKRKVYKRIKAKVIDNTQLNSDQVLTAFNEKSKTFVSGWPMRCWDLIDKHKEYVVSKLQFKETYTNLSDKFIEKIRIERKYELLIGVLIRQGDYKEWAEGKFYFQDTQYIQWIEEIKMHFFDKKIAFILTSDQPKNENEFATIPNLFWSRGTRHIQDEPVVSMLDLSHCDYILSPPSTFSAWASFIGNSKIIPLTDKNQKIDFQSALSGSLNELRNHHYFGLAVN